VKRVIFLSLLIIYGAGLYAQRSDSNKRINGLFIKNANRITVLGGKSINYYLNNQGIDLLTKNAFKGGADLSKESVSVAIFDSLMNCKNEFRPFYFSVFNELVERSEEGLKEKVAEKCALFVKQFPCDFFNYFNEPDISINVVKWTTYIGKELKDRNSFFEFKNSVDSQLKTNCPHLQDLWKSFQSEVRMCLVR